MSEGMHFEQPDAEKERIEQLKNLILTNEQAREHPFYHTEGEERTYVFRLEEGGKRLTYFGSPHTNDPADPVFDQIAQSFSEIDPDMVYVEGMDWINKRKDDARGEASQISLERTKQENEAYFVLKLGIDAGADFESPEPALSDEINYLLSKDFLGDDIFRFYLYRDIDEYLRGHGTKSLEDCKSYLEQHLNSFREASGWGDENLDRFEEQLLSELDVGNGAFYNAQVDPIPWEDKPQTVLNEISRGSNRFRDEHIFERIVEGLKTHNHLFVVYGSAHAVMQEPALRALFGSDSSA
jgi:hypothetical protein